MSPFYLPSGIVGFMQYVHNCHAIPEVTNLRGRMVTKPRGLAAGGLGNFRDFQIYTPKEYYTPSSALKDNFDDSKFDFYTPGAIGLDHNESSFDDDKKFEFYTPDAEHEIGHFYVGYDHKFGQLGR